ncbi:MAG: hypothetical protein HKN72_03500 [Gemmatimonadetes bacterium]|nr:hypothetical protein [Gemmatimonadota bacterium]
MGRTFEEVASGEMDALYQGALFLCGGSTAQAETLVVDAVMLSFQEHAADADPEQTRRWFEARLVRSFLRRARSRAGDDRPPPVGRDTVDPMAFEDLGAERLFQAAGSLPPGPRSALWLVLLRRWSRADAAAAMEIDEERLKGMLGYRDALMKELLASRRPRGGREAL